jgi:hypothetical protein
MLATLLETPAASAAGLAAMACLVACPLLRTRWSMLLAQLGVGVFFALHYGFMGVKAAALVDVLGAVQTLAALFAGRHPALGRIGYALIPLMAAVGLAFWSGPTTAFAVAAMAAIAYARMQEDQVDLRLMLLGGTLFWAVHDALVGSWIALSADLATGVLGLGALLPMRRQATHGLGDAVPT